MFNTIENIQSIQSNESKFNGTVANKTLSVKNILRSSRLFALLAIAIFTFTTGANNIQAEVTYDSASYLSPAQQQQTARYFAEMAFAASPACAQTYLMGKIRGVVPRAWLGTLNFIFGADDGCTVAKKASYASAWLLYSAEQGRGSDYFRLYVYKERRNWGRPDLCHVRVNVQGKWVVGEHFEPLKYSTVGGLVKCLGER